MGVRSFLADLFGTGPAVNPATGLPMMGGSVDAGGNPYGVDLRRDDNAGRSTSSTVDHHAGSPTDNDWSSSSWSGVSSSWPDHSSSSSSSSADYDPSRGW